MKTLRTIIGLAVGSGHEGVDAVLLTVEGHGLAMIPRVTRSLRLPFTGGGRDHHSMGDALAAALRRISPECRDVFCIGLISPGGSAFNTAAETIADRSGVTVLSSFAARDLAAGGAGAPLTPVADFLIARDPTEDRVLIHLGGVSSIVLLPAGGRINDTLAFDCGPCNAMLDAIVHRGTREKEHHDSGGTKAVQGKLHDQLLMKWSREPYLSRKPPKLISKGDFAEAFLNGILDDARQEGLSLNDLLCTATHFVARCILHGVRIGTGHACPQRHVYFSGGGTRNGFLRQLLAAELPVPATTDAIGIPAQSRKACTAAVLAGLTLDGVTGTLPQLTGATGGRLVGRITPGDPQNWGRVAAWVAEQMWDHTLADRAA